MPTPARNAWSRSSALDLGAAGRSSIAAKRRAVEVVGQRVGAEPRDAGHLGGVARRRRPRALLRAGLGEVEAAAVGEPAPAARSATCPGAAAVGAARRDQRSQPARARWKTRCRPSTSRSRNLPCRATPSTVSPRSAGGGGSKVLSTLIDAELDPRDGEAVGALARGSRRAPRPRAAPAPRHSHPRGAPTPLTSRTWWLRACGQRLPRAGAPSRVDLPKRVPGTTEEPHPRGEDGALLSNVCPAASYSPTPFPVQYHRR